MKRYPETTKLLYRLGREYHEAIPLDRIFAAVELDGSAVVDEDGEPWEGLLFGNDSRADFALEGDKKALHLQWHRMESGRFEINGYIL